MRVADGSNTRTFLPKFVKTELCGLRGGNHQLVQRAERRTQQRVVERKEHDETRRTSWSSTASGSISGLFDLVLLIDSDGLGRESEVDDAQLLLTLIKIAALVI